ncbi:MAG TPA: hypothetical protein VFV73_16825 [Streptosporangiaceae bacterium]|nr:hypothetical protein [Streptosporangiaceae bacterium]
MATAACASASPASHEVSRQTATDLGQGRAGQFLELRRVHGHRGTGAEQHLVAAEHHRARHADGVPGVVRRLVQLRHRRGDRVVRPAEVDDLLAVQPPARRQGQDFHHRRRVTPLPGGLGDRDAADRDREPAEQRDADVRHRQSLP